MVAHAWVLPSPPNSGKANTNKPLKRVEIRMDDIVYPERDETVELNARSQLNSELGAGEVVTSRAHFPSRRLINP
jgi:hypothetical protein